MSISTLEEWYSRQCNGEWEHGSGVKISTIDNPGWSVGIDLRGTRKETATFERIKIDRGHDNWIHYWAEKQKFQIACGPLNLSEAIEILASGLRRTDLTRNIIGNLKNHMEGVCVH